MLLHLESGQVIGRSITSAGDYHAFYWTESGGMVDLGTLGGRRTYAIAINESGQVVGYSQTGDGEYHAFLWTESGGMVDLGTLGGNYSVPKAINASGEVTGYSRTGNGEYHAFLWTESGGMTDLNDHVTSTAPPGMVLQIGQAISDHGKIVVSSNAGLVLLSASSAAPVVGPISLDYDPAAVGVTVSASAGFTDENTMDTHTAEWNWGDGTPPEPGSVSESNGTGDVSGSHSFSEAGIYSISLSVTDNTGLSAQTSRNIVVYDPSAGFVTGGGWIISPIGAYKANALALSKIPPPCAH